MKKSLGIRIAAVAAAGIVLAGCGNNTNNVQENSSTTQTEASSTQQDEETQDGEATEVIVPENTALDESGNEYDTDYVPNMMQDEAYATRLNIDDYVTLGEYKGLSIDAEPRTATEGDIDRWLEVYVLSGMEEDAELDDAAVAGLGIDGVSTVEELRAYAEDSINSTYASGIDNQRFAAALKMIVENSDIKDPPRQMKERLEELLYRALGQQAMMYQEYGVDKDENDLLAEAMERDGYDGDISDYMEIHTLDQCREEMVMAAIAEKEGLTVDEEELEHELEHMLEDNGFETAEEYTKSVGMDVEELMRIDLLREAVAEFILAEAD